MLPLIFCLFAIPAIISADLPRAPQNVLYSSFRSSSHATHAIKSTPDFLVHLTNVTFDQLFNSNAAYFIVDPQYSNLSPNQINDLKMRNKIVLAYLDLTKTDNSRPYWLYEWDRNLPDFIYSDEHGNYHGKFWSDIWQRVVLRFMREYILSNRYSGIFLDGVGIDEGFAQSVPDLSGRMVTFVRNIRSQATTIVPATLIFLNAVPQFYEMPGLSELVDGLGVENAWFEEDSELPKDNELLKVAKRAQREGRTVLAMDAPSEMEKVCMFYERCYAAKFICAVIADKSTGVTRECEAELVHETEAPALTPLNATTDDWTEKPRKPSPNVITSRPPGKRPNASASLTGSSVTFVFVLCRLVGFLF